MDAAGLDTEGRGFTSAREMWKEELGAEDCGDESNDACRAKRSDWYQKGIAYWQVIGVSAHGKTSLVRFRLSFSVRPLIRGLLFGSIKGVEASMDGVLGGYGHVNDSDVKGSEAFLKPLLVERFGTGSRRLVALGIASSLAVMMFGEMPVTKILLCSPWRFKNIVVVLFSLPRFVFLPLICDSSKPCRLWFGHRESHKKSSSETL